MTRLLRLIRTAHIARIDAAMHRNKADTSRIADGLSGKLVGVGIWLAAHGFDDASCEGERWFGFDFDAYRTLSSPAAIEAGRRAIWEGRHPLLARVADEAVADPLGLAGRLAA